MGSWLKMDIHNTELTSQSHRANINANSPVCEALSVAVEGRVVFMQYTYIKGARNKEDNFRNHTLENMISSPPPL